MRYEKYDNVIASSDRLEFQFESDGPKGKIKKVVQFAQTQNKEIYNLTARYPDKTIFFCGTTSERTRLYRMALTVNLDELKKDFRIYGVLKGIDTFEKVLFRKGVDYFGFMVKRKKV